LADRLRHSRNYHASGTIHKDATPTETKKAAYDTDQINAMVYVHLVAIPALSLASPSSWKIHCTHNLVPTNSGHNFPDFIEHWNRDTFRKVGYGLGAVTLLSLVGPTAWYGLTQQFVSYVPAALLGTLTTAYWHVGLRDMEQTSHAIRRNFPVLGNLRYVFEMIRPELHQYIVEGDSEGRPFDRNHRAQVYRRAKGVDDTLPFGTRRDVYEPNHEWVRQLSSLVGNRRKSAPSLTSFVLLAGRRPIACGRPRLPILLRNVTRLERPNLGLRSPIRPVSLTLVG
jgi:hypothetical protein